MSTTSPIARIVDLARALRIASEFTPRSIDPMQVSSLAMAVLDLLVQDGPCGWDKADVASDAGDGYVRAYAMRDLTADEAHWIAMVILEAALAAKEQGK